MGYSSLSACVRDLEAAGQLARITETIDPRLEAAEIHRRVYRAQGPALLFENVKGSSFPMLSNLFGTIERARYVFRDTLDTVHRLMELRADPHRLLKNPWRYRAAPLAAIRTRPRVVGAAPVLELRTNIASLPQLVSWPDDGGAFITLPQVYTESPERPGFAHSNLGMYRVQLSGGRYAPDREVGLHYQIHRGIGVHHARAAQRGDRLPVNIFVGGPPAMALAAVMPLPEDLSELSFAGVLNARRVRMAHRQGTLPVHAEADFCIRGFVEPSRTLPEGPFGDHLGYYSLAHDFPVMTVEHVTHRKGAIWPFTVVGRPPQEDTVFGQLIHELTASVVPAVLPGVRAVHAVDATGVHPLLLAVGSERYTPYERVERPKEILTQANAILGQGQMSLAKYLMIAAEDTKAKLDVHDVSGFLQHVFARADFRRDLHFQTETTIDTLDYSGTGLNAGSKLVIAAAGPACRILETTMPESLRLPDGFSSPAVAMPGVLVVQGPPCTPGAYAHDIERFCVAFDRNAPIARFALVVVVDDAAHARASLDNLLWHTFTRSDPARDVQGVESFTLNKHWGCHGPLVIDARLKPHHAPPLVEDAAVSRRVDALAAKGGPLHGIV
jgi:4-hydroxy-3-polyprenylbenzoate decarboxylase